MCGISGIFSFDKSDKLFSKVKKMTDAIKHRGPDGEGHWMSENRQLVLGHRRLSIIDMSSYANQPMHYGEGETMIASFA